MHTMKPTAEPKTKRRPVELEIVTIHQYDEAACLRALRIVLAWPVRDSSGTVANASESRRA